MISVRLPLLLSILVLAGCGHGPVHPGPGEGVLLIAARTVELSKRGDPIQQTEQGRYANYRFVNAATGRGLAIHQANNYVMVAVEAGTYCLRAYYISTSQTVPLDYPICLVIMPGVINNAGIWTLGYRVGADAWYARVVEAAAGLDELLELSRTPKDAGVIEALGIRQK